MKLIHLSDLHLGKRLHEFSLLDDQAYILQQIVRVIDAEQPDAVLLAGDIYDKAIPSAEAVSLFDDFLVMLAARKLRVFVISGNHDSPERIAFGSRILNASGIHLSPVYHGQVDPIPLRDGWGEVRFYLLPFVKPVHVRRFCEDAEIASYTDAIAAAVAQMDVDPAQRNVLLTHQFVTDAARSDSEELSVGGSDNVDTCVFEPFDYVALGHLHRPQNCGAPRIRYCGTPLKYSFSEAQDEKSVTVVELREKGNLTVRTVPLTPRHDLVELRGRFDELTFKGFYENTSWQEDYTQITLTDEEDIPDAFYKLRVIYHRLMNLRYDNRRTRANAVISGADAAEAKSPMALFSEFYALQNNQPLNEAQAAFVQELIETIWEENA